MTYETLFRNLSLKTEGKGLVETLGGGIHKSLSRSYAVL